MDTENKSKGSARLMEAQSFQQLIQELSTQLEQPIEQIKKEAREYLEELYTEQKPIPQFVGSEIAQFVLARGYDRTIDVDPGELKKLTKLMRKHPIAFVMTHKTYIDMIVLGIVLIRHGMPLPHTFAGINMDFLGLGQFGRNTGVIFIRRAIKENLVYRAVLRYYIKYLINEREHFMWALEGTRSRTGKLVWPKMGILKYIMEGEQDSPEEVKYVPVSIVYDLIPDVKDMTLESLGKGKKPESLGWFLNYLRKLGDNFGKISIRFDHPVHLSEQPTAPVPGMEGRLQNSKSNLPRFAFQLVHRINQITPVTTTSLVCTSLLSKYALNKREIERDVADLMLLIESHKKDALVDRGQAIGASVQKALNLLMQKGIIRYQGGNLTSKYQVVNEQYMQATYYSNMAAHHLYHRAFIELALMLSQDQEKSDRQLFFWTTVMDLRDLFKFEFFYAKKPIFSRKIEGDLALFQRKPPITLRDDSINYRRLLSKQKVLVAPVVLFPYLEAYKVIVQGLKQLDTEYPFDENNFIESCLALGGELQWKGKIQRIESVSKPFLVNGIRLAKNLKLIPTQEDPKTEELQYFEQQLEQYSRVIQQIQDITLPQQEITAEEIPMERSIVPGSRSFDITQDILKGESGPHIAAFFDLDRTLIKGFSAREFFQARFLSGKMSPREIVSQFAGVMVYALGNGNFAGLAALGAKGVQGVKEQVFIDVGEEVYLKHLADEIYPESRALVAAHLAKGHTVAIVSAATPYQVNPIARDLGIEEVMCTRMEVQDGTFTGRIIEPACWGEGKAYAAQQFTERHEIELSKSYFYTDSAEDLPLLEMVGYPRPMNPDIKLSGIAYENDWPIYRFNDEIRPGISNFLRTGLTMASLIPAAMGGVLTGASTLNWQDGINNMIALVGDLGTAMAGISVIVKNEENIWNYRPAVFLFNHQSNADLFIIAKLLRRDVTGVAKKELQNFPILGQMMASAGIIFVDRQNREQAIEALQPAVETIRNGTSLAIAPEGTRSYSYKLGKFKKGAFHLAMQAGVPLVPIVIKNAHDAMPRGSNVFRPTAVEVVVLPGIPTEDWKREELNENIAKVRQLFLDELGQVEEGMDFA
ncbi:MAG TPA: HAD-IB family hydrolase [Saprospiraceae bacterium]|nr:HAD-IB family hydrolase [Saprospiraceae bacterium]